MDVCTWLPRSPMTYDSKGSQMSRVRVRVYWILFWVLSSRVAHFSSFSAARLSGKLWWIARKTLKSAYYWLTKRGSRHLIVDLKFCETSSLCAIAPINLILILRLGGWSCIWVIEKIAWNFGWVCIVKVPLKPSHKNGKTSTALGVIWYIILE